MAKYRTERVGELLLSFLSQELRRLSDPRFEKITLTGANVSPDLKNARIYWAAHGVKDKADIDDKEQKILQSVLDGVTGLLKRRVGEELKLRYVPQLRFTYDESINYGFNIENILLQTNPK
jgi:ribosome-binding factor A